MRALKLIRSKKPSVAPIIFADKTLDFELAESKNQKSDIVWQPRPQWLRKPGARQNLWN